MNFLDIKTEKNRFSQRTREMGHRPSSLLRLALTVGGAKLDCLAAALVDQLQGVGLQDALDLGAGVDGPRAGGVELDVGLPVFEGLARLA
jgi:hypothetical protein